MEAPVVSCEDALEKVARVDRVAKLGEEVAVPYAGKAQVTLAANVLASLLIVDHRIHTDAYLRLTEIVLCHEDLNYKNHLPPPSSCLLKSRPVRGARPAQEGAHEAGTGRLEWCCSGRGGG